MRRREVLTLIAAAGAGPLAAHAQQTGKIARIGYLALVAGEDLHHMRPFVERLRELGFVQGENSHIIYRSAEGRAERLPELAAELVRQAPDVLVAGRGTLTAQAAKAATTTIPIVFATVGDPLGAGLVSSLARPGGNVTGLSSQVGDIGPKRLQLVQELIPGIKQIAVLMNPETPYTKLALQQLRSAAEAAQVRIAVLEARSAEEMPTRFEVAAKTGALIIIDDPLVTSLRQQLSDLASANRLPTLYGDRVFPEVGGLASYGPDRRHNFRRAADYVYKIISGAKAADMPVEQPTSFQLVLNLRAARQIGLSIPTSLVARADEVIE